MILKKDNSHIFYKKYISTSSRMLEFVFIFLIILCLACNFGMPTIFISALSFACFVKCSLFISRVYYSISSSPVKHLKNRYKISNGYIQK
jgi:hypothetical protein